MRQASKYEEGVGVDQDRDKAKYYYDEYCKDESLDDVMFELGKLYLLTKQGDESVEQALLWFKKAEEKHNVLALVVVSSMYMVG